MKTWWVWMSAFGAGEVERLGRDFDLSLWPYELADNCSWHGSSAEVELGLSLHSTQSGPSDGSTGRLAAVI